MKGSELSLAMPRATAIIMIVFTVGQFWALKLSLILGHHEDKRQLQGPHRGTQGSKDPSHKAPGQGSSATVFWARGWVQPGREGSWAVWALQRAEGARRGEQGVQSIITNLSRPLSCPLGGAGCRTPLPRGYISLVSHSGPAGRRRAGGHSVGLQSIYGRSGGQISVSMAFVPSYS